MCGLPRLIAVVRLSRPLFLIGGIVFHLLGASLAWHHGAQVDFAALAWCQLIITAVQLMTHFSNEYFDLEADRAHDRRPPWSGGSGVLVAGMLPARWGLVGALVSAMIAVLSSAVAVTWIRDDALTVVVLATSLCLAWSYSSPPLRLHSTGFGELAGALLIAGLTPILGYLLQQGRQVGDGIAFFAPLVLLQFSMLVLVSLPDTASDGRANKRTLAVRLTPSKAARIAASATMAAFLLGPPAAIAGGAAIAWPAYVAWSPLGAWLVRRLWTGSTADAADLDSLAFWGIGLVMGPAATMALILAAPVVPT